jgi:hypothetical protein
MSFDPVAAASVDRVAVEVYTSAYRVSGTTRSRFKRVGDIVNQLPTSHLIVDDATISEYAAPNAPISAGEVLVAADQILFLVAPGSSSEPRGEMRIPKRPVRVELLVTPFRLSGAVHIPQGSRPMDGLLNAADRFIAITDVSVACAQFPAFAGSHDVVAMQRSLSQLLIVSDDEQADQLLADVIDETTAKGWLNRDRETGRDRRAL